MRTATPSPEGVTYTLSAEGDLVNAPDPEGGSNYVQVRYVKEISMVLENVGRRSRTSTSSS